MIQVKADPAAGLMTFIFGQKVTAADAKKSADEIQPLLAEMQPNFRVLVDLSALESMDVHCAPFIARIMDQCNGRGVSKVVRVIPDPRKDIGLKILSLFHYNRDVRFVTCQNMEEARKALST